MLETLLYLMFGVGVGGSYSSGENPLFRKPGVYATPERDLGALRSDGSQSDTKSTRSLTRRRVFRFEDPNKPVRNQVSQGIADSSKSATKGQKVLQTVAKLQPRVARFRRPPERERSSWWSRRRHP